MCRCLNVVGQQEVQAGGATGGKRKPFPPGLRGRSPGSGAGNKHRSGHGGQRPSRRGSVQGHCIWYASHRDRDGNIGGRIHRIGITEGNELGVGAGGKGRCIERYADGDAIAGTRRTAGPRRAHGCGKPGSRNSGAEIQRSISGVEGLHGWSRAIGSGADINRPHRHGAQTQSRRRHKSGRAGDDSEQCQP